MSDFVPPEIVTEILIRLPVKSLLRSRCVCKRWFSLISNPSFPSKHLSHSHSKSLMLIRHYSKLHSKEVYNLYNYYSLNKDHETATRITFPFNDKSEFYLRIVGSCNGLLCLSDDLFGYKDMTVILWNPSIRRSVVTPLPKNTYKQCGPYMFALGFGFVAKTDDYKVVRVAYVYQGKGGQGDLALPPRVELFSLSSNTWTVVKPRFVSKVQSFITEHFWSQAVVGSVVHWVGYNPSDKKDKNGQSELCGNLIMRFDLESERFVGDLGLPEALAHKPPMSLNATVLRGLLSLLCYNEFFRDVFGVGEVETSCSVWVMKDYDNVGSWTQLYKVGLKRGIGKVLSMKREGELILCDSRGELFTYDCENKEFTGMGIRGSRYSFFVDEYVESLVLLGKGEKVGVKKKERDYELEDKRVDEEENRRKMVIASSTSSTLLRGLGLF